MHLPTGSAAPYERDRVAFELVGCRMSGQPLEPRCSPDRVRPDASDESHGYRHSDEHESDADQPKQDAAAAAEPDRLVGVAGDPDPPELPALPAGDDVAHPPSVRCASASDRQS